MRVEIKIPTMGESVSGATIARIIKENGSPVRKDDELLELETDKVNQVLYAPATGQLTLQVKVGESVAIGQVVGWIEAAPEEPASASKAPEKAAPQKPQAAPPPPAAATPGRKKMSRLRQTVAERLVAVKNETAMLTTFNEVDLQKVVDLRTKEQEAFQKKFGIKLGFMAFFIKATTLALKAFPTVASMIEGDEIVQLNLGDIGVAVSTDRGLMVPVVRGCDRLSLGEIEQKLAELAQKARDGKLSIEEMRGGGFTITNGGVFGSLLSTPILNPPQSAILGMHAIVKRPIAIDGQVAIRPMMYLALSYDHRIIDGKEAVQFLGHVKESLEHPEALS